MLTKSFVENRNLNDRDLSNSPINEKPSEEHIDIEVHMDSNQFQDRDQKPRGRRIRPASSNVRMVKIGKGFVTLKNELLNGGFV